LILQLLSDLVEFSSSEEEYLATATEIKVTIVNFYQFKLTSVKVCK